MRKIILTFLLLAGLVAIPGARPTDFIDGKWYSCTVVTVNAAGDTVYSRDSTGEFTYVYDTLGNMVQMTDGNGSVAQVDYDTLGNAVHWTVDGGTLEAWAEYSGSRQTHTWTSAGQETWLDYDSSNAVHSRDNTGMERWYRYDGMHRVIYERSMERTAEGDEYEFETWYEYDPAGHLAHAIGTEGTEWRHSYDSLGHEVHRWSNDGINLYWKAIRKDSTTYSCEVDRNGDPI